MKAIKCLVTILLSVLLTVETVFLPTCNAATLETTDTQEGSAAYPQYYSSGTASVSSAIDLDSDEFRDYLAEQFRTCPDFIDLSAFNIPYVSDNYNKIYAVVRSLPEIYAITLSMSCPREGDIISGLQVTYGFEKEECMRMLDELTFTADMLLDGIENNSNLTDVEKALLIHDRLCLWNEYDHENYNANTTTWFDCTAYGPLVERDSVCSGYTDAYTYLLRRAGIKTVDCGSCVMNHGWNIAYIDGIPYHIDTTWDDPAWPGGVLHFNFLVSTQRIIDTGHDTELVISGVTLSEAPEIFPSDARYDNSVWSNIYSAFQLVGDEIYYIDGYNIRKMSDNSVVHTDTGLCACLSATGNELLYSKCDGIYSYNLSDNSVTKVFSVSRDWVDAGYILESFNYENGCFVYTVWLAEVDDKKSGTAVYDYEDVSPEFTISSSSNFAATQTVTLNMSDDTEVSGFYWGKDSCAIHNKYTWVDDTTATVSITEPGTYYFAVRDKFGNMSETKSISFCEINLNTELGTLDAPVILAEQGKAFTLPTLSADNYTFHGWSTAMGAQTGSAGITPASDIALYAAWQVVQDEIDSVSIHALPDKTVYYIGDAFYPAGLKLAVKFKDNSVRYLSYGYGFGISGFSSSAVGTRTLTVSGYGKSVDFDVEVKMPYVDMRKTAVSTVLGEVSSIEAYSVPAGQTLNWTSTDSNILLVSSGNTLAKALGKVTVTAEFTYNGIKYSATCEATVIKKSASKPSAPSMPSVTATKVMLPVKTGYEYKLNDGPWQSSNVFDGLTPNTEYKFYQRKAETDDTYASESSAALTLTTPKLTPSTPSAPTLSGKTDTTVTLNPVSGCEYSKDGEHWQSSNVFEWLSADTTYSFYQRVAETASSNASECSAALSVTTDRPTPEKPLPPTVLSKTANRITLVSISGYEYKMDDGEWRSSNVFTGLLPNSTHSFYQRIAETDSENASHSSDALVETTDKDTVIKPSAPTVESKTDTTVTLTFISGYQYKMDDGEWQSSNVFSGLSPYTTYRFYQRKAETDTAYASDSSNPYSVTTEKASAPKPEKPSLQNKTDTTVTLNAVSGCEYSKNGTAWQNSNVFTGLMPYTTYNFYQRVAATDSASASPASDALSVTTDKSTPSKPSAPTLHGKTDTSITLAPVNGYEYSKDGTTWQTSSVFSDLNESTQYTFYQRVAATNSSNASEKSNALTVTTNPSAPTVPSTLTSTTYTVSGNSISKITALTKASALLAGIKEGEYCKVFKGNSPVAATDNIGTGMLVKIMDGNTVKASYTVAVTGDTNGDGDITITDMLAIKAHILNKSALSGVYKTAADTSGDKEVSITDFIQIKAKILGKGDIVAK